MRLFIVRHAKATDAQACCSRVAVSASEDFSRELTSRGHAQARFLATRLSGETGAIRVIVASRYPRALQTAHEMQRPLSCDLKTDIRLELDHDVGEALEVIQEHAQERSLMLVGHNPQLGELISVLCSGLAPQELILKTGEMVVIDLRAKDPIGSGKLVDRVRLADGAGSDETVTSAVDLAAKPR